MKKNVYLFLMVAFTLGWQACQKELTPTQTTTKSLELRSSVTPVLVPTGNKVGPGVIKVGDAYSECSQAGSTCDFAWKVDAAAPNGDYHSNSTQYGNTATDFDAIITISNSDGKTFDWTSTHVVCKVLVKAGTNYYVYTYPDGACGDEGLVAPEGKNISHVTFCFSETLCEGPEKCYQEETAWAAGTRYVNKGNWATYTSYDGVSKTIPIYAGQSALAGSATLEPDGASVKIVIQLNADWVFYYDGIDPLHDNNIKIQDYAATPPAKNPAPGKFSWKSLAPVGSHDWEGTLPNNKFYGIHLDVAKLIDCP